MLCVLFVFVVCSDPFALDGTTGAGNDGISGETLLLGMFLVLIAGLFLQLNRNRESTGRDSVDLSKPSRDRNDRDFEPPELD